jgi:hypothetical protein
MVMGSFKRDPYGMPITVRQSKTHQPAAHDELLAAESVWKAMGPLPIRPTPTQIAIARRYVRASRCQRQAKIDPLSAIEN